MTLARRNLVFTSRRHDDVMLKEVLPPIVIPVASADPVQVLDSIVSELESLSAANPQVPMSELIELHGALLAYEMNGQKSLVPAVRFPLSSRVLLETRVIRAAKRVIGQRSPEKAVIAAAITIEELIHHIDPDLRSMVA